MTETGPDPDEPSSPAGDVRYTVAAVARRLGVAPATLRTWDRRYGVGPSDHESGSRRRYSRTDLQRLESMRRLTLEGVAPAEAAALALAQHDGSRPRPDVDTGGSARGAGSGGRVLAVPGADAAARGLARAAMALDAGAVSTQLRRSVEASGVIATWDHVLRPVLVSAGRRWELTGAGVDVEHLLSECATGAFRQIASALERPRNKRPVLLACAEDDLHSLPLYALAAALAEGEVGGRILGPAMPRDDACTAPSSAPGRRRCSSGRSGPPPPTRVRWRRCPSPGRRPGSSSAAPAGAPGLPERVAYAGTLREAADLLHDSAVA